ncbi:MAG TPA: hypothetical protein VGC42_27360, partial [Kofleriaceae bacterium]
GGGAVTRILITGGPRTGKTTLAGALEVELLAQRGAGPAPAVRHTDDMIEQTKHLGKDGWSEASRLASLWLDAHGPWIIEGVAASRRCASGARPTRASRRPSTA